MQVVARPTGGNLQPTHFMVITNPDVLKELVTLVQEEYGKTEVTEQTPPYMVNIIKMSKEGKICIPLQCTGAHRIGS